MLGTVIYVCWKSQYTWADGQPVFVCLLLMSNGKENNRWSDVTLWVKHRGSLIIKLKAIKYKEDILSYLSSYTSLIFFAQYLVTLVKYQLVMDMSRWMDYSNNFDTPTISLGRWVIELLSSRGSMQRLCLLKSAPTDKPWYWILSLQQLLIVPHTISE